MLAVTTATWFALLGGLMLLVLGGEFLVRGAAALAARLGMPPLVIGLTVVAFGTSLPELVVSLGAALDGVPEVALGNVLGSNIANIALILGAAALVRPLSVDRALLRRDAPLMLGASVLVPLLLLDDALARWEGLLLAGLLVTLTVVTLRGSRSAPADAPAATGFDPNADPGPGAASSPPAPDPGTPPPFTAPPPGPLAAVLFVLAGLAALVFGGDLFVGAAVELARDLGVSEAVIGLTLVAVGTSLPELATSLIGVLRGQTDLAVGNVIGSNLFNLLGILGVTASVHPLPRGDIGWPTFGVMLGAAVLLFPMLRSGQRVSRAEGAVLLAGYAAYIGWLVAG